MTRHFLALFALLPLTGCSTQAEREAIFDNQLREMAGAPEAGLLKSMGRIPDSTYQLEDGTKILQWRWDTSYIDPGMAPMYTRWGGLGAGMGWRVVDADGRLPADARASELHRRVDHGEQLGTGLSLAGRGLPESHALNTRVGKAVGSFDIVAEVGMRIVDILGRDAVALGEL